MHIPPSPSSFESPSSHVPSPGSLSSQMFEGKDRRQELIKEMRTTHALQLPEQKAHKKRDEQIKAKQRAQEREKHKVIIIIINETRTEKK